MDWSALYARYDGPIPDRRTYTASPASWELMMRMHLRAIRRHRHAGNIAAADETLSRLKEIRRFILG